MKRAAACILFRTRLLIFWQTLNVSEATLCPGNHLALLEAAFSLLGGCSYKMPASQPFQRLQVNKKVGVREFKCGCLGECKWQILETGFYCLLASTNSTSALQTSRSTAFSRSFWREKNKETLSFLPLMVCNKLRFP